jgi:anti-anti-sigma factor
MINLSGGNVDTDLDVFEIRLEGEFDLSERERLTDAFSIANSAALVILNLSKTTYMDSAALECAVALELATRRRNAHLVVTGVSGAVQRLLQVSCFDGYFDVQPKFAPALSPDSRVRKLTLVSAIEAIV